MDNAQFRKDFPAFADTARYPESQLDFWSGVAETMVNQNKWGSMYATGIKLYVAHEITLSAQDFKAASFGGVPGQQSGPVNTKTVGSATIGFDTQGAIEKNAGWWNLTTYGKQFFRLMRMFGAGPIQL